jgi:membrane protein
MTTEAEKAVAGDGVFMSEVRIMRRAARKWLEDHGTDLSAAIAFYAFFSIFPLLLGVISAAGYFFESKVARDRLYGSLNEFLPGSADLVRQNLESVVGARGALGAIGLIGLFWSGSAGFGAITRGVNRALGAKRTHPYLLARLRYVLMTLVVSLLLILSVSVTATLEILAKLDLTLLARLGIDPGTLSRIGGSVAAALFAFLIYALIYKVTPYIETHWRQILPGAVLGAVLFELGKYGFLFYLGRLADFEAVYGPLSSIIVLLLWLYLSAAVLIFGAEYNIVRWRARHPSPADGS